MKQSPREAKPLLYNQFPLPYQREGDKGGGSPDKKPKGGWNKMVEIECLLCGGSVKIPTNTDTEQYDGQGVCQQCESLIHVKLVKGKVQEYEYVKNFVPRSTSKKLEELLSKLRGYRGKAPTTRQRHSQE